MEARDTEASGLPLIPGQHGAFLPRIAELKSNLLLVFKRSDLLGLTKEGQVGHSVKHEWGLQALKLQWLKPREIHPERRG
jgi:hypothetical protein